MRPNARAVCAGMIPSSVFAGRLTTRLSRRAIGSGRTFAHEASSVDRRHGVHWATLRPTPWLTRLRALCAVFSGELGGSRAHYSGTGLNYRSHRPNTADHLSFLTNALGQ